MASEVSREDSKQELNDEFDKEESMKRLSKRLAYLLRYGAVKEGLDVDENGFVELDDLCGVKLLEKHSRAEVLEAVMSSTSYRHTKRYDWRQRNGQTYVRAAYLRNFEKNPCHAKTNVKTLFETSMSFVLNNLDDYDLQDFPDEHTLRLMIRRLKREKRLTTKALQVLLAPTVTMLDLEGVYLTRKTLRTVWTQCPNLARVSLKDCGYIITDSVLAQLTKNLPGLKQINLCLCSHLTDKCLNSMAKNLPQLNTLHMAGVPALTAKAVVGFINKVHSLKFLDVFYLRTTPEEHTTLTETADERNVTLILRPPKANRGPEKENDNNDNVSENVAVDVPGREGIFGAQNGLNEEWSEEAAIAAGLYLDGWGENIDEQPW